MIVSYDWLRAFVPHALTAEALGELLGAHVATLDGIERVRADLEPFVVGRVLESERIPDTKLTINRVDDGTGVIHEVVCGAPNVQAGRLYPFARVGTTMPGGTMTIERRKIRGFTSAGMLCSARELGLGADHAGILELETDAEPGTPLLAVLPVGDVRLELDVLANRPDLFCQRGVAREAAALTGVPLQTPPELRDLAALPAAAAGPREVTAGGVTIRIDDVAGCPRYCAAVIRGVRVGPSPEWLVRRLEGVGTRSINNVVDATNYCLHGLGQPMHAFDLAKLGSTVVVRAAREGERLRTLDGVDRTLRAGALVIADATRPVAVAGVMGGEETEVDERTTDVLLEVAYFDPRRVRASRLPLGLSTDASYRFERGVDREATLELLAAGAGLIAALGGGQVETVLDVGAPVGALPPVTLRADRLARLLGAPVPAADVERLLSSIGFGVEAAGGQAWRVSPPSWRHDVTRDVDLVEEVARLVGFDVLPDELRPFRPGTVPDHPLHLVSDRVRDVLVGAGLLEARPLPFVRGDDATHVRVTNPLAEDEPHLRRSILETLGRRAEHNLARMEPNVRLFEIGAVFAPPANGAALPDERLRVGAVVMGERRPSHFTEPRPPAYDVWDAKWLGELVARAVSPAARVELVPVGQGDLLWRVEADGVEVGGVHRLALDAPPWASPAFGVEIELGPMPAAPVAGPGANVHGSEGGLPAATRADVRYRPLPTMPAAVFDLALLTPDDLPAARVDATIRAAVGELLERLELFDEYRGEGVPAGTRSLAWRLTLRHPERTLGHKEIEGRRARLLKALGEELGVRQRG
ncbi:MAG TPA: phenylalanine--tRNA ligase subunit beta [Gemmatimonadaceae bacterium]|nr:phenylalanine--tRNA ligase subunit beta [Gemmatimonadaceae bacterium]